MKIEINRELVQRSDDVIRLNFPVDRSYRWVRMNFVMTGDLPKHYDSLATKQLILSESKIRTWTSPLGDLGARKLIEEVGLFDGIRVDIRGGRNIELLFSGIVPPGHGESYQINIKTIWTV